MIIEIVVWRTWGKNTSN